MYKYTPITLCKFACVIFIILVGLSFTGCDNSKIITDTAKIDNLEWRAIAEIQELVGYYRPTWRPRYETRTKTVSYQEAIKEPVYATKYYYTIDRWVHLINVQLACGYDQDYNYLDYVCAENERVHNVEYQYLVKFEGEASHISHPVDKDTWESLQVGQEISVQKDQYGIIYVDWDKINNT